jgi:hypothetical protein
MGERRYFSVFFFAVLLAIFCRPAHGSEGGSISVGATLPEVKLEAPAAKAEKEYLGLKDAEPFTLSQVSGKIVILDFFAVL